MALAFVPTLTQEAPMFFGRKKPAAEYPILHARDDDFDPIIHQPGIAVVDFWAPWCGPCKMMEPILGEISLEWADQGVRVVKVNVDEAQELAASFEIRSIPTLVFFQDGEPLFEMVGLVSKPILERELGEILNGRGAAG
jgi:thioredoxin 1